MTPTEQASKPARPLAVADVDRLADEIAEVASHIDAATHRLLTLIRRFDEGSGWAQHGALSCAHWLNWRIGLDLGAARERVRVARALGSLPTLDDALRRGAVSYSKVRAITRAATSDDEATLLEMAQHATASQLEKICRGYRRALTNLEDRPERLADEEQRRFVRVSDTSDGMVRVEARLRPEEAALVLQALDVARRRAWRSGDAGSSGSGNDANLMVRAADASSESAAERAAHASAETRTQPRTTRRGSAQQNEHEPRSPLSRADALVAVAEAYLSTEARAAATRGAGAGAAPIELVVHVDDAALRTDPSEHGDPGENHATLDDGTAISNATAQRLACDASVVRITEDDAGNITARGRRTRRISATLRRALRIRDDGCRFPGCTNRLTDAHHAVAWARGGATHLSNLCSLCRRHHRLVHEQGYRIERVPAGELRFLRRDGSVVPETGKHRALPEATDAFALLRAAHAAGGLDIDARTALPRWDGEAVDYDLTVRALVLRRACEGTTFEAPPA